MPKPLILWFEEIAIADVPAVGGKNASLGEMTAALSQKGVKVPSGFATTAEAYRAFVHDNQLAPLINQHLAAFHSGKCTLQETRSEEHTSELQSLMRITYAVFCLKKKKK